MRSSALCRGLLLGVLLSLLLPGGASFPREAQALELWVTSPWLGLMARFIGGAHATVHSMRVWGVDGRLVGGSRPQPRGLVVALDPREAAELGISAGRPNLRCLYRSLPFRGAMRQEIFFDPAALPFVGQRLLIVLAKADQEHYAYFQRRLAEFQSRMESTLEVGRQLLQDTELLDLAGLSGAWIRAAIPKAVRPPEALWKKWESGGDPVSLRASLDRAESRGWLILLDPWTPGPVREAAAGRKRVVHLPVPRNDQEMFLFYYDLYLTLWNTLRGGAAPTPVPK